MKKLFCPSDYLALPGCLEEELVRIGPYTDVPIDIGAIRMNEKLLREYFRGLPKYESWVDLLPFNAGNEILARMAVVIGDRVGAWEMESKPLSYHHPKIIRGRRVPKPSRGDLKEKPALLESESHY